MLREGKTQTAQAHIQHLVKQFFKTLTADPTWENANRSGILTCPVSEDWKTKPFVTHIVPMRTRPRYTYWLMFHLMLSKFCSFAVEYPTVPKGQGRVRVMFHAHNTEDQVEDLAKAICAWAKEMLELEEAHGGMESIPTAARQVYAWMADGAIEAVS